MASIVFIDARVAAINSLLTGFAKNVQVIIIDAQQDGIDQMAAALAGITGLSSIHIFSHGSVGTLYLGATTLNSSNLSSYQSQLSGIGSSLTDSGDILLYGCDVARGDHGQTFIQQLAAFTGANVAVSNDLGGDTAVGEYREFNGYVYKIGGGNFINGSAATANTQDTQDTAVTTGS